MLFAFSRVAAAQLTVADGVTSPTTSDSNEDAIPSRSPHSPTAAPRTVTLPPDSCTPAALEYVLFWMKRCCTVPTTSSIDPLPSWRGTLGICATTKALGVPDAEKELYRHVMGAIRHAPLTLEQVRALVDVFGRDGLFVREAVRRSAGFARRGEMEEVDEVKAWLKEEQPALWGMWSEFDRKVKEGRMVDTTWVGDTIQREIERLELDDGEKPEEMKRGEAEERRRRAEEKVKEVAEKLQRQRRLAALIE